MINWSTTYLLSASKNCRVWGKNIYKITTLTSRPNVTILMIFSEKCRFRHKLQPFKQVKNIVSKKIALFRPKLLKIGIIALTPGANPMTSEFTATTPALYVVG
jgi:hypothetical protein